MPRVRVIPRPGVRSKATTLVYADVGYRLTPSVSLGLSVFNLLGAKVSDIDYYYVSRLPGEPDAGVADVETHPSEPRELRAYLAATF